MSGEPGVEGLRLVRDGIKASMAELEERIKRCSQREVAGPSDSKVAEGQREFWSEVRKDLEGVRMAYVAILRLAERGF